jgi:hypothetical protein
MMFCLVMIVEHACYKGFQRRIKKKKKKKTKKRKEKKRKKGKNDIFDELIPDHLISPVIS